MVFHKSAGNNWIKNTPIKNLYEVKPIEPVRKIIRQQSGLKKDILSVQKKVGANVESVWMISKRSYERG